MYSSWLLVLLCTAQVRPDVDPTQPVTVHVRVASVPKVEAPNETRIAEFAARGFYFAPASEPLLLHAPVTKLSLGRLDGKVQETSHLFRRRQFLSRDQLVTITGEAVEIATFPELKTIRSWKLPGVKALAVAPQGNVLATISAGDQPGSAKLATWEAASGKSLQSATLKADATVVQYSTEDGLVVLHEKLVAWHKTSELSELASFPLAERHGASLAISWAGEWMTVGVAPQSASSASSDAFPYHGPLNIRLWNPKTKKPLAFQPQVQGPYAVVAAHPAGQLLAVGAGETISLWNVPGKQGLYQFDAGPGNVTGIQFSPDGKLLGASVGQSVRVWDLEKLAKRAADSAKS